MIGQIYSKLTFLIVTKTDLENFTSSFYIIYILPIKTNLYRWGFKTDGRCLHCGLDEDIFIQCNLFCLFDHTNKDGISYWHCNYIIDIFLYWYEICQVKIIVNLIWNITFKREIYKRIEEDMNCKKNYNFPQQLFSGSHCSQKIDTE